MKKPLLLLFLALLLMPGDQRQVAAGTLLPRVGFEAIPMDQVVMIGRSLEGLVRLAGKSPLAAEDLAFVRRVSVPAVYNGADSIKVVIAPAREPYFFMVADPTPRPLGLIANFYCLQHPYMSLFNIREMEAAQPFALVHEIRHAYDCLIGHEPLTPMMSPLWLLGEADAYQHASIVLDQATDGGWKQVVGKSIERRRQIAGERGYSSDALIPKSVTGDDVLIRASMPGLDQHSLDFFALQLVVDAGYQMIGESSRRKYRSAEETENALINFMAEFYKQFPSFIH
jgi:hypothetical protein